MSDVEPEPLDPPPPPPDEPIDDRPAVAPVMPLGPADDPPDV